MNEEHGDKIMIRKICMASLIAILFLLLAAGISFANSANSADGDDQVKIGVLCKRGAELCLKEWSPTAEYLTTKIPGKTFVIIPLDHEHIYSSVEKGEVDFILPNSSFYVELEHRYGVNRIATLKNKCLDSFYTKYCGVIFWKAGRKDMRNLNDLKGKTFMAISEESFGGWRMAWRELKENGIDPYKDFKALKFTNTIQDDVVYAVRDGKAEAGTVRTDTLIKMHAEGKINIQNFYIVENPAACILPGPHSTRAYPEWPMAELKHTSDILAEKVAIALLEMPADSPEAIAAKCGGWTIPLNYQSVHDCLKYLKVGPYKDFGKITITEVIKKYWYIIIITFFGFFIMTGFTIRILRLNKAIKTSHVKLEEEIGERYQVEKELVEAKKTAESCTRIKSSFLANMSHEIRTPMNGVIAATDLALNEDLPPKAKHYLEIVKSSAYSLLELINDILDFSKIEAARLDLKTEPFVLDSVLERISDMFLSRVAEKSIELLVDIDPETPKNLIGDCLRLQQIIKNLVDNAIKFSNKSGIILIGIKPTEKTHDYVELSFFVKDTGIGIDPEYIPDLFRRFTQADMSTKRQYAGTGLGLSICKQLVEMMEGKIGVKSEKGKGSTFFFTARFKMQAKEQSRKLAPPPDLQGIKTLVVDDCADSITIIEKMLASFDFQAESVSSGKEALHALKDNQTKEKPFKLVIIDWLMPEMDGLEVSKKIRKDLNLDIPIIMITAFGRETEKTMAMQEKINAFLNKPISQSILFNTIMDVFGKEVYEKEKIQRSITTKASIYKNRLKGARILVAEDNPTNQEVAKAILEGAGIIVEIADNGEKAVQAAKEGNFDAILMDIQMPEMDGFEATMAIRQDSKIHSIPIIAMTAHAMKGDQQMCLDTGMDAYVAKPIRQDRLFETLYKAIKPASLFSNRIIDNKTVKTDSLPPELPGINIEGALNASKIDSHVFKQILTGFFKNNKETAKNIRDAFTASDWLTLSHMSHSLKGSAGNIGAEELYDDASNLEIKSREGQKNPPDSKLVDKLESTLDQVLKSLESLVEKSRPELPEVKKIPLEPEKLLPMLKRMADALDLADPEEIKRHFNSLKQYIDDQMIEKLESQIDNYDYDNALKIIKQLQG